MPKISSPSYPSNETIFRLLATFLTQSTYIQNKIHLLNFDKNSIVTKQVSSFIKSNLTKLSDSCSYIKFNNETSILTFDFRYLELSISTTAVWEGSINLTNDIDPHFDFVITRLA